MATKFTVSAQLRAEDQGASQTIGKVEGRFKRFGNYLKQRFVFTLSDVGTAVRAVFQSIEDTATLENQTAALRRNLALQGQGFDEYIAKLRQVSDNQISTAALIESSSRALLLGIPAEEIASLLDIARVSALATGQSVAQAFEDITTGIGRASPLILDNLGITVRLGEANEALAAQLGKTTEELTGQEKSQALLNEVLRVGADRVRDLDGAQSDLSRTTNQATAAMNDFKTVVGSVVSAIGFGLASIVTRVATGFVVFGEVIVAVTAEISKLLVDLPLVGGFFQDLATGALEAERGLRKTRRALEENQKALSKAANERAAVILGLKEETDQLEINTAARDRNSRNFGTNTGAVVVNADAKKVATVIEEEYSDVLDGLNPILTTNTGLIDRNTDALLRRVEVQRLANSESREAQRIEESSFPVTIGGGQFTLPDRVTPRDILRGRPFSVPQTTRTIPGRNVNVV